MRTRPNASSPTAVGPVLTREQATPVIAQLIADIINTTVVEFSSLPAYIKHSLVIGIADHIHHEPRYQLRTTGSKATINDKVAQAGESVIGIFRALKSLKTRLPRVLFEYHAAVTKCVNALEKDIAEGKRKGSKTRRIVHKLREFLREMEILWVRARLPDRPVGPNPLIGLFQGRDVLELLRIRVTRLREIMGVVRGEVNGLGREDISVQDASPLFGVELILPEPRIGGGGFEAH
ncbi:hypothetical protein OQA88_1483 [Cercophora sp. LCS_1]